MIVANVFTAYFSYLRMRLYKRGQMIAGNSVQTFAGLQRSDKKNGGNHRHLRKARMIATIEPACIMAGVALTTLARYRRSES